MQLETGQGSSYNIPDVIGRGGGVCVAVHRGVMTMEKERLLWRKNGHYGTNRGRTEGSVLFNDVLNTFYLRLYGIRHIVKDHSETRCRHMGYFFRLTARALLYTPSHRQDSTYHGLCYTSRGALAGMRNSSMRPP